VLDFPASNGFRTPCTSFTNFSQLLTIPVAALRLHDLQQISPSSASLRLSSDANNTHVAFFIRVSLVNASTGLEVAPQLWSDNYVSLLPGASRRLVVAVPGNMTFSVLVNASATTAVFVAVEQWSDV
jgi:hypothetical protein